MGWQFGHYRLEELIGRGGMGEVYRAYDTKHQRVVAVKLLPGHAADDQEFRRRFIREGQAAARLREPHVIPIHAYGEIDGRLYLDMRLVEGEDLRARLAADGPMSPVAAVDLISQVASALDAAHADGLVHRDVKPSNVVVDSGGFAYLVDFGVARSMTATSNLTATNAQIGTLAYMAPERFAADSRVDHRADVYSLACVLFQCLTNVLPFPGEDALVLMHAHLNREPPRPSALGLPPAFDQVIAAGMAKRPEDRFASAGELASAARLALTQPSPTRQATRPIPVPRPVPTPQPRAAGRGWLVGTVAAVAAAAAVAGAAAVIWLQGPSDDESPRQQANPSSTVNPTGTTDRTSTTDPTSTTGPTTTATTASTATTAATPNDLSVSVPISKPACDGSYIVIVDSAVDQSQYQSQVQGFLDMNPGARYLHAPSTGCRSLRHHFDNGADIYAVYYGPFRDERTACNRWAAAGGDASVRRLDNTSIAEGSVKCG